MRNHCCSLFLRVLRCFSSPGSCPDKSERCRFTTTGCPIRTPADQWLFAPPRSFSQLTASFVIPGSQGIPHAPLLASFPCWPRDSSPRLPAAAPHPVVRARLADPFAYRQDLNPAPCSPNLVNELLRQRAATTCSPKAVQVRQERTHQTPHIAAYLYIKPVSKPIRFCGG